VGTLPVETRVEVVMAVEAKRLERWMGTQKWSILGLGLLMNPKTRRWRMTWRAMEATKEAMLLLNNL